MQMRPGYALALLCVAWFRALTGQALAQAPLTIDPRVDTGVVTRPAVEIGDEWLYRRSNGRSSHVVRQSVTAVNDQGISLKTQQERSDESSIAVHDREWGLLGSGFNDYRPALAYYSFPLYPGKRWGIDSNVSNFGAGQSGRMKGEGRVAGWEEVVVPAGRFLALRIEISIETADPGDSARVLTVKESHWYARAAMRPVKVESETSIAGAASRSELVELLSYRLE